jgi:regulation of enolase protein 1 (concanavalin A-like superfamily)
MRNSRKTASVLIVLLLLMFAKHAIAQNTGPDPAGQTLQLSYVRLVLFTPSDLNAPGGFRQRLTQIAQTTDAFFSKWMKHWGYPSASGSLFRRESDGLVEVLAVQGDMPVASGKYGKPNFAQDVIDRATRKYNITGKGVVWWIFVYLGDRPARFNDYAGDGNPRDGGWAMVNYDSLPGDFRPDLGPAEGFNGQCFLKGSIHELGHAFGLPHVGPDLGFELGNSLMGPTNAIYASRKLPKPDQAYLTESSAAMLWKHPIFSGDTRNRFDLPKLRLVNYESVFDRTIDSVVIAGKLESDQSAHSVVLIDDRGQKDEYWFPSYVGRIGPGGRFRIIIHEPARTSGRYRILFCFDNGLVTGDGVRVMFDNQGYIRKSYRFLDGEFQFSYPSIPAGVKFAAPFRDDFAGALEPGWRWVDPKGDSSRSLDSRAGFLRIAVHDYHDLWSGSHDYNAPRLVREADGDFTLETKLAGPGRWCGGLLVWKDEDNFVRLDRGIQFRNDVSLGAAFEGEYASVAHEYVAADPLWLRLRRTGSVYTALYSVDGEQWRPLKRSFAGPKKEIPKAPEDSMSLLKEEDMAFRDAAPSLEMKAPGPFLVGLTGIVPAIPRPYGTSRTSTDYDYFVIRGK